MHKRIFKPISAGGATALIAITSFISYAIGLLRDHTLADSFGAKNITDAYNASFMVPDILFNMFIAGALSAAFLPVFSEYLGKDKKEAFKLASIVLTAGTIVITVLSTIAFIFMPQIVPFILEEATVAMQGEIIGMTRIMLGSAVLFAISNTLGNILMSYKHFFAYALSPILYNLGIILGIIYLHEELGIYSAAVGVIIGVAFHAAIRIIDTATTGIRLRPNLNLKHPGFKKILKLMLPKSIGLVAWQINLLIYAKVGFKTVEGSFSAFQYARNIQSISVSLFGIAFATAIFPFLTDSAKKENKIEYTDQIRRTIQRILFFTIPAMIGVMMLSYPIVELILGGGEFDENSIRMTSLILFFFAFSIPFESLVHILARAYYARQNTATPMLINLFAMLIIGVSTYYLVPMLGIQWFSIGFTIGYATYVLLIGTLLRKHMQNFKAKDFISSISKTVLASAVMALALYLSAPLEEFIAPKLAHAARIVLGAATFFVVATIIKAPEISSVNYILNRIFKKKTYEG